MTLHSNCLTCGDGITLDPGQRCGECGLTVPQEEPLAPLLRHNQRAENLRRHKEKLRRRQARLTAAAQLGALAGLIPAALGYATLLMHRGTLGGLALVTLLIWSIWSVWYLNHRP